MRRQHLDEHRHLVASGLSHVQRGREGDVNEDEPLIDSGGVFVTRLDRVRTHVETLCMRFLVCFQP